MFKAIIIIVVVVGVLVVGAVIFVGSAYLVQPQACHAHLPKADASCTPGVADPAVTQGNIRSTICVSGYTATVRPPSAYTDALKRKQMRAYGETAAWFQQVMEGA